MMSPEPKRSRSRSNRGHSDKKEKDAKVKVVVRCRPRNSKEKEMGARNIVQCSTRNAEISVTEKAKTSHERQTVFKFDHVFDPKTSQQQLFEQQVKPIVLEVLRGFNCTVFAYGQTGTGKTFTMEGDMTDGPYKSKNRGIIPRTVNEVFKQLESVKEYSVKISFLELYNEELSDLLSDDNEKRLRIFGNDSGVTVSNLEETHVQSADDVFDALEVGFAKRRSASTLLNEKSSRSHSIFTMTIYSKASNAVGENVIKTGKLHLVDLAGSECIGRSGAVDKRAKEAGKINKSLLTLGRVINALVERHGYVPYRDSKLTRLLKESLGGSAKTLIIATISPAINCLDETMSTLSYAHRAKNIENKPQVNSKLTHKTYMNELLRQIQLLKRENEVLRNKNGIILPPEQFEEMEKRLKVNKLRLQELNKMVDEQKYIMSQYAKSEETISQQALTLKDTLENVINDKNALHDKISRKSQVEQHNKMTTENFQINIKTQLTNMNTNVHTYTNEQQDIYNTLNNYFNNYNEQQSQHVNTLLNIMNNMYQSIEEQSNTMLSCFNQQTMNISKITSNNNDTYKQMNENIQNDMNKYANERQNQLNEFQNVLKQQENQWNNFHNEFTTKFKESTQLKENFVHNNSKHINELNDSIKHEADKHCNEMNELKESLVSFQEQNEKNMKHEYDNMMNNVSNMMKVVMDKQQHYMNENIQKFQLSLSNNVQNTNKYVDNCNNQTKTMIENNNEWLNQSKLLDDTQLNLVKDYNNNQSEQFQNMMKITECDTNIEHISKQMNDAYKCVEMSNNEYNESSKLNTEENVKHSNEMIQNMKTNKAQYDVQNELYVSYNNDSNQYINNITDDMTLKTNNMYENNEMSYNEIIKQVDNYAESELKVDISTGVTPIKRDFKYPNTFVRTKDEKDLIEEFRALQEDDMISEETNDDDDNDDDQNKVEDDIEDNNTINNNEEEDEEEDDDENEAEENTNKVEEVENVLTVQDTNATKSTDNKNDTKKYKKSKLGQVYKHVHTRIPSDIQNDPPSSNLSTKKNEPPSLNTRRRGRKAKLEPPKIES